MSNPKTKVINLALQGGGSHGAFTWGVLDRLLEDGKLHIGGISGASSGAMNAAILAYGFTKGGTEGARKALRNFWERIATEFSEMSVLNPFNGETALDNYLKLTKTFSPYQLNPLDMNPLRALVQQSIEFDSLRSNCPIKLFIAATQVRTGKLRIFENQELTVDTLMASACLPSIHKAVEIENESYWDGGFAGNPPVFPLIFNCKHNDIVIVMLHPLETSNIPTTAEEIRQRASELSFNTAFLREMRAIAFSKEIISGYWLPMGRLEKRLDKINIHLIEDQAMMSQHNARSRFNTLPSFLDLLFKEGYATAGVWLENNFKHLGKKSSVDLAGLFC
jgi:Predicted esterase of the alpha-beta hydrolase superfamily